MGERGDEMPALQVIVLGAGGGPKEDNVTAFLVRATATGWKKGSILAVDAGVHLSAITRILEKHGQSRPWDLADSISSSSGGIPLKPVTLIDGPFEGLEIPHVSTTANAAYIHRELVEGLLLTHPHLDHVSGFVINTASLPASRPKRIAGLPSTIEALKVHIFNNTIWPNLTDENNGAGLITLMRLVEGGSPALGDGDSRGYVEVCNGLSVKTLIVSHGHCIEKHGHRGSNVGLGSHISISECSPRLGPSAYPMVRTNSASSSFGPGDLSRTDSSHERYCVVDSSAYFIRDVATGKEVLIFGDVEPDSISLSPRNHLVWTEAAPKIAAGNLGGILIECSYDNSRPDELLFGHMKPQFLIEELKALAEKVVGCQVGIESPPKRKRNSNGSLSVPSHRQKTARHYSPDSPAIIPVSQPHHEPIIAGPPDGASDSYSRFHPSHGRRDAFSLIKQPPRGPRADGADIPDDAEDFDGANEKVELPLKGVRIVIIHVKEKLDDGPAAGDVILKQLRDSEEQAGLGCEFIISSSGQSLYF